MGCSALGIRRRLDETLTRIEQEVLQVQIHAGESDRLQRRLALAHQATGQSFLVVSLVVGLGWLKLKGRLRRNGRLEQLPPAQLPAAGV